MALVIAALAGVATLPAVARPTGSPVTDAALTSVSVAFVTWAGASAPWWPPVILAGAAAGLAVDPVPAVVGCLAFALALWIGIRRREAPALRAVTTGVALNVALWSGLDEPLGLVAAVIVPVALLVAVLGIRRRVRSVRRIGWAVLGAAGAVVVAAGAMFALTVLSAASSLADGDALVGDALDALDEGEFALATARFDAAADRLAQTDRQLSQVWTQPARLVPVVAQHRRAAASVAAEAARGLRDAADALAEIDPQALRMAGGVVDLDAIDAVENPLARVQDALRRLDAEIESTDSIWLAGPVRERLGDLADEVVDNEERLTVALDAARVAPGLLGADGERRYLVLVATPSEARGLGGFPGNYAEITARGGRLTMTDVGRIIDLERTIIDRGGTCGGCPPEFVDRYGRFGFDNGSGGGVGVGNWRNITAAAHFPYVAETAQVLYPQSGGRPIDGVLVMDPYVIEQLVEYTGPIEASGPDLTVDADNVLSFLLFEQYLGGDRGERVDALETIGTGVIARLLSSPLPTPPDLADDFAPLVRQRRLLFWTDDPDEQEVLGELGLLGAIPALPAERPVGFSVAVSNAGASKIDAFLRRDVELSVSSVDTGVERLVAEVTLHNDAPAAGLPPSVIGNAVNRPAGTSRLWVTFYGPDTLVSARLDGQDTGLEVAEEAGWTAYGQYVDIPPESSVRYRLEFEIPAGAPSSSDIPAVEDVVTWEQPIVRRPADRRPRDRDE